MIVCSCNAFGDEEINTFLASIPERKTSVKETYAACSKGKKPNCGMCTKHTLKDMVDAHNKGITPPPKPTNALK